MGRDYHSLTPYQQQIYHFVRDFKTHAPDKVLEWLEKANY